jgi:hypothetical protein
MWYIKNEYRCGVISNWVNLMKTILPILNHKQQKQIKVRRCMGSNKNGEK